MCTSDHVLNVWVGISSLSPPSILCVFCYHPLSFLLSLVCDHAPPDLHFCSDLQSEASMMFIPTHRYLHFLN